VTKFPDEFLGKGHPKGAWCIAVAGGNQMLARKKPGGRQSFSHCPGGEATIKNSGFKVEDKES
jgi:hypothetical protein